MILLFGGTSEGKRLAALLASHGLAYTYSTKERTDFVASSLCRYRQGPLTADALVDLCMREGVRILLDGSHPFAADLHKTLAEAGRRLEIPVLRFERHCDSPINHEGVLYLEGWDQALEYLRKGRIERLLALTGIQSIAKLKSHWETHETWFRILPRPESLETARRLGLSERFILPGLPSQDPEEEIALIRKLGIEALITKESGHTGGLPAKIKAAQACRIPILILRRPPLPESFAVTYSEADLMAGVTKVLTWT